MDGRGLPLACPPLLENAIRPAAAGRIRAETPLIRRSDRPSRLTPCLPE